MDVTMVLVTKDGRLPERKGITQRDIIQNIKAHTREKCGLKKEDTLHLKYGPSYSNPSVLIDILEETDWIVMVADFDADYQMTIKSEEVRKDAARRLRNTKHTNSVDALFDLSNPNDDGNPPKLVRNGVHTVILLLYEYPADARYTSEITHNQAMDLIVEQVRKNPNDETETIDVNIDNRLDNPKTLAASLENGDHLFLLDKLEDGKEMVVRIAPRGGNFDATREFLNGLPDGASAFKELRKLMSSNPRQ